MRKNPWNNLRTLRQINRSGKRGFTLTELCVVIALVGIMTAMIVTFTVMMNRFSINNDAEYTFAEENNTLKQELREWITKFNTEDRVFLQVSRITGEVEDDVYSLRSLDVSKNTATSNTYVEIVCSDGAFFTKTGNMGETSNETTVTSTSKIMDFKEIDFVSMELIVYKGANNREKTKLIKCTSYGTTENGKELKSTFVLPVRIAVSE